MDFQNKATRIRLFDISTPQMRAFHLSWFAFFLCVFGWFGIVPLMKGENGVIESLSLTKSQIGNCVIASVLATVFARLAIGAVLDRVGARIAYTCLLCLGSVPVMLIGLSQNYEQFLIFRLAIGLIGGAFVITQYHTSVMFAPNIIGTANATTAGWGNIGGGVTQAVMPMLLAAMLWFGFEPLVGWRYAMVVPGIAMLATGMLYWFFTQDAPEGNYSDLRASGKMATKDAGKGMFWEAAKDKRVIALFFVYAACFGVELTMNGTAALYFFDNFELNVGTAGLVASLFGLMNIFTRTMGGYISDRVNSGSGLQGRVRFLSFCLFFSGIFVMAFSQVGVLVVAIPLLIVLALFTQMSEGATFAIVPFVNKRALGSVAGIVGAGGNVGAVLFGFLFKGQIGFDQAYLIVGASVFAAAFVALAVRFSPDEERTAKQEVADRLAAFNRAATGEASDLAIAKN